jgi:replicative DNA helicase
VNARQNAPGPKLPGDLDAEHAVIASLLVSPASYEDVVDTLCAEDFLDPACAAVFAAIVAVEAAGRPIDLITVADELRRVKQLTRVGGADKLATFADAGAEIAHLSAHAAIVADKARLRRVIEAGRAMCVAATAPEASGTSATDVAESLVFDLGKEKGRSSLTPMTRAVPDLLNELAKGRNKVILGHPTGIADLDKMTGGLQGGQLWVLAARPGVGKSALALQMARHVAEVTGLTVPFLSYEMTVNELTIRMLASALGTEMSRLRSGDLPAGIDRDLAVAAEKMAGLPLLIDDNPPPTIAGVRAQMRRLARRAQLGAIFIDYVQLMDSDRRREANRNDVVSDITRGLKTLAMELNVPIVICSQLSRAAEQRGRPQLSDLRDSGSIEQDANTVLFVYREAVVNASADPTMAELLIRKQRSGPVGTVYCEFDSGCTRFRTTTRRPSGGGGGGGGGYSGGGGQPF